MERVPSGIIIRTRLPPILRLAAAWATTWRTSSFDSRCSDPFSPAVIDAVSLILLTEAGSRCDSFRFLECQPALVTIGKVRHMARNRRAIAQIHRRVWRLPAFHAVDPVGNVILGRTLPLDGLSIWTIDVFRVIVDFFFRPSADHLRGSRNIF